MTEIWRQRRESATARLCTCRTPDPVNDGHAEGCASMPLAYPEIERVESARRKFFRLAEDSLEKGRGQAASFWTNQFLLADTELESSTKICGGCDRRVSNTVPVCVVFTDGGSWSGRYCPHCLDAAMYDNEDVIQEVIERIEQ